METRDIAAVLIGLEVGLGIGLLAFGTTLLAPMGIGLLGAAAGYVVRRGRLQLIRRALRSPLLANWEQEGFGADGVVTGMATIAGRPVALMANDPTVKAGSWGPKTVEKILRIQESALAHQVPMVYLVDSAGARVTEEGIALAKHSLSYSPTSSRDEPPTAPPAGPAAVETPIRELIPADENKPF